MSLTLRVELASIYIKMRPDRFCNLASEDFDVLKFRLAEGRAAQFGYKYDQERFDSIVSLIKTSFN